MNIKLSIVGIGLVLAASSFTSVAGATPLEETERWALMSSELDTHAANADKRCGTKLTATYDMSSYKDVDVTDKVIHRGYARQGVYGLEMACRTAAGKKAVNEQVKKIVVRRSTTGTRVTLAGGVLMIHIDHDKTGIEGKKPGSYSWASAVKEVL